MEPERLFPCRGGQLLVGVGDHDGGVEVQVQLAGQIGGGASGPRRLPGRRSTCSEQAEVPIRYPVKGPPRRRSRRHRTEQGRLVPQSGKVRDRPGAVRDGHGHVGEDLAGHMTGRHPFVGVEQHLVPGLHQTRRHRHLPQQLAASMRHNPRTVRGHPHPKLSLATLHVPSAFQFGSLWTSRIHSLPYRTGTLAYPALFPAGARATARLGAARCGATAPVDRHLRSARRRHRSPGRRLALLTAPTCGAEPVSRAAAGRPPGPERSGGP